MVGQICEIETTERRKKIVLYRKREEFFVFDSDCNVFMQMIGIYEDFVSAKESGGSQVSEKGVLQVLLDLRFASDILSGGDSKLNEELVKGTAAKISFKRKQDQNHTRSLMRDRVDGLVNCLSQRLDPIDWLT